MIPSTSSPRRQAAGSPPPGRDRTKVVAPGERRRAMEAVVLSEEHDPIVGPEGGARADRTEAAPRGIARAGSAPTATSHSSPLEPNCTGNAAAAARSDQPAAAPHPPAKPEVSRRRPSADEDGIERIEREQEADGRNGELRPRPRGPAATRPRRRAGGAGDSRPGRRPAPERGRRRSRRRSPRIGSSGRRGRTAAGRSAPAAPPPEPAASRRPRRARFGRSARPGRGEELRRRRRVGLRRSSPRGVRSRRAREAAQGGRRPPRARARGFGAGSGRRGGRSPGAAKSAKILTATAPPKRTAPSRSRPGSRRADASSAAAAVTSSAAGQST